MGWETGLFFPLEEVYAFPITTPGEAGEVGFRTSRFAIGVECPAHDVRIWFKVSAEGDDASEVEGMACHADGEVAAILYVRPGEVDPPEGFSYSRMLLIVLLMMDGGPDGNRFFVRGEEDSRVGEEVFSLILIDADFFLPCLA